MVAGWARVTLRPTLSAPRRSAGRFDRVTPQGFVALAAEVRNFGGGEYQFLKQGRFFPANI